MKTINHKTRVHPAAIRLLTNATWDFAHRILWNNYPFSEAENELSKLYIMQYYESIPAEEFTATAHKQFTAFCERILLAKEYVSRFTHRYIPHPCIWLNKMNPKGFAGTKAWYLKNLERQKKHSCCMNSPCDHCGETYSFNPIFNQFHFRA